MSKPIVIIGAGVIGCLLGMILKKRDIPFTILEKNKELKKIPYRTVALTKDTVLFLNSLDKKIDINRWATPVSRMELYQDHDLTMTLNKNDNDKVTSICLLYDLHEKLIKNVQKNIKWDEEIIDLKNPDNPIVQTNKNKIEAEFLFATDGMNSKVRQLLDFESEDWFYGQKAYVTCVKAKHNNVAKQYFLNSGTLALLPLNDKEEHYSIIFCSNSTGNVSEDLKEVNDKFALGLNSNELELGNGFELKHSRAKNLYIGKTVLCGDAANTFHPMAGQGLNLGIGDIMQLNNSLDQIISGDMHALSEYNKKRNSKNIQMTWIIQSIFGAFGNADGLSEKILNSGMKFLNKIPDLKEKIVDYANKN
ncbi:MAG: hypothetical protein CBC72_000520 [Gammaproteobacteria bacterium TMED112]|nr:MAG: hypothetical protein CBC72_000520 [Gammaproteobacteria bacterium TMED112]|tara:strand:+ start:1051 stop:2139 length:1089 start_codon:yes stop_codon:yes gene_type:complete